MIFDVDGGKCRMFGNAGIAGRCVEFGHQRRLRQLPGERMLASARSDQQNFHGLPFSYVHLRG